MRVPCPSSKRGHVLIGCPQSDVISQGHACAYSLGMAPAFGRFWRVCRKLLQCAMVAALAAFAMAAPAAGATAAPGPSAELDRLLRRIDFHGAAKPDVLGKALAELPPSDWATLCDMLVEAGAGDDTKPRMALEGLAWYTGSSGTPAQRAAYIEVLTAALSKDRQPGVKAFLIRQLQLVGDDSAVPTLGKLLLDAEVYDFAAQALVTIGSDAARAALRAAYSEAQGPCRIAIIQALGVLRDSDSADRLAEDANGPDRGIQLAALPALANMDSPAFREAARKFECQTHYERSQLDALLFRTSAHAAEEGEPEAEAALTAELQSADPHIRSAALSSAAGVKSIDLVLSFLADEDAEVRATATNIAISLQGEGVTAAYLERLPKATETGRVALIGILGKRGDAAALSAVLKALQDESPAVRLAAVEAAAALGRTAAVEPLIKLLSDDGDLRAAAQRALTNIRDEQAAAQIAGALSGSPPRVQARLLQILADSHAVEQADAICGCLEKEDEGVRLAALRAVEALAPSSALDPLVRLLPKLENSEQREACESALTAVCRRAPDRVAVSGKLLAALPAARAEDYCSLLRVLGKLGGAEAFQTVRQALGDSRSEVVEAAFRALSTWPDPAAAANILEVAAACSELRHHVLALRAYVRLVGADQELSAADKLAAYEKCIAHTRRVDERKLLLSRIGELPEPRTISVLQRFLLDDQLRNEAGAALLGVAERQLPAGWQRARQAIWLALDAVDDDALRERGKTLLARAEEYEGFVTDWQVAGPFEQDGKGCLELLEVAFAPEQPDAPGVTWQRQTMPTDRPEFWYVDLNACANMAGSNRVAYLRTVIDSPRAQDVQLELGSDDALKVWLNGELIHTFAGVRGCERGQDKVPAQLKKGRNELLLKVVNGGGGWAACARLRQPDGSHVEGLKIDLGQ